MPAGIVLAGGRSSRMGRPKAWLDWHGTPLLRRVCGLVARGASGPVVVVRAPGQELPPLPAGIRAVEDAREGRGPFQGLLAGLEAIAGEELAFVAATDVPFLHPRFVSAVCRAAAASGTDAAVPRVDGHRQPLLAAYRTSLAPVLAELVDGGRLGSATLFERVAVRWLDAPPHPESVRNLNGPEDYEAARAEPEPHVRVRCLGTRRRPAAEVRAATLGAAAAAVGVALDGRVAAAINGDEVTSDPGEPLAEGDEVALRAAAAEVGG
jgi:molybdenum cofactor guanylyltransferase